MKCNIFFLYTKHLNKLLGLLSIVCIMFDSTDTGMETSNVILSQSLKLTELAGENDEVIALSSVSFLSI